MTDEIRVTVPMTYAEKDTIDEIASRIARNGLKKKERVTANSVVRVLVRTLPFRDIKTEFVDDEDSLFEALVNADRKDEYTKHPDGVYNGELYVDGPYFKVEEGGATAMYNYPPRNMPFDLSQIIEDDHLLDIRRLTQKTVVDLVKIFFNDGPNLSVESILKHYKKTKT